MQISQVFAGEELHRLAQGLQAEDEGRRKDSEATTSVPICCNHNASIRGPHTEGNTCIL